MENKTRENASPRKIMRGGDEYKELVARLDEEVCRDPRLLSSFDKWMESMAKGYKWLFYDAMLYNSCTPDGIEYRGKDGEELWGDFNLDKAIAATVLSLIGCPALAEDIRAIYGEDASVKVWIDDFSCNVMTALPLDKDGMAAVSVFAIHGFTATRILPIKMADGKEGIQIVTEKPLDAVVNEAKEGH